MFSTVISVGILVTITLIVLFSAASYLTLPSNETVMVASPSPTATISPNTTVATFESLEVYVNVRSKPGFMLAPLGAMSNGFSSIVSLSTVISVGILVTITLIVLFSAAAYLIVPLNETVMVASPSPTAIISPNTTIATLELLET